MPQRIVVLTAVHAPGAHHLPDAYRSLQEQELPDGWEWQWVIQEDGETDAVAELVPDDPRVSFAQGRRGGPGVARTMGLARAQGELVKVLDADDMLTPGALARDIAVFEREPDVAWTTSRVLDALPDGTTIGFDGDPEEGPIERGSVHEHWKSHDYRAQVHPATLCVRRDLLLALGGWMALPASEDTGLLLALNAVSRGYFTREVGLMYRKWPGQATNQAAHGHKDEREARMAVVDARVRELVQLNWRFSRGEGK
ncbi:glycosyltransferase family 2 protein [Streptomyces marispadix]|uniref:Glycosyltransferase family 2 protein n=1 Tax=Streptomyces marispadix TaxID=2922868 RepID=A0ABS9SZ66_9ACTN|nr:glycosyltransferase [Streptomyces marispadix]MCH6161566.1 glycosyltransferase family 2 protein [Streptomyces marispadix]